MLDVLVLGGGVAGLSAAVRAARAGCSVSVVTKTQLGASATQYAQGGVAAVLTPDPDSPELHLSDTLAAGAGLCDADAVRVMVEEGPTRVRELIAMGAHFDRSGDGLAYTREGGHSVARIVHAGGDATGAEIERALVAAVQSTAAEVRERWFARDVLVEGGRAVGVRSLDEHGVEQEIRARHTIIATGGAGQCFAVTTNPALSTGDGIAMALRAGVAVADVEFMQFHPTALHYPSMPRPLLSEALRGEGAILRDEHGEPLMRGEHPLGDLAPRDVVARAIARRCIAEGLDHMWLDATPIAGFAERFPTVWRACQAVGLDPTKDWLPVAPAAHYLSGGVCADLDGATTLAGLWACGEAACSGVHGANRLASNSLLDGLVFGSRCVDAIVGGKDAPSETGVLRGILNSSAGEGAGLAAPSGTQVRPRRPDALPGSALRDGEASGPSGVGNGVNGDTSRGAHDPAREAIQRVMTVDAGVLRDAASLSRALVALEGIVPVEPEVASLWEVSRALAHSALAREESRGTHTRLDFPETRPELEGRLVYAGGSGPSFVRLPEPVATR
jgi:L-aspartate oxidase